MVLLDTTLGVLSTYEILGVRFSFSHKKDDKISLTRCGVTGWAAILNGTELLTVLVLITQTQTSVMMTLFPPMCKVCRVTTTLHCIRYITFMWSFVWWYSEIKWIPKGYSFQFLVDCILSTIWKQSRSSVLWGATGLLLGKPHSGQRRHKNGLFSVRTCSPSRWDVLYNITFLVSRCFGDCYQQTTWTAHSHDLVLSIWNSGRKSCTAEVHCSHWKSDLFSRNC